MRYDRNMRTTLDIDPDVLEAARALARQRRESIGAVISELARNGLNPNRVETMRNGIRLFPVRQRSAPVTPELIKAILEESE